MPNHNAQLIVVHQWVEPKILWQYSHISHDG